MSAKQIVTIVSRGLAVYFLGWFLTDLTYLPSDLFDLWHRQNAVSLSTATTYWRDAELLSLSFRLLRMVALFFAIQWFYRSGPSIQGYFLASVEDEPATE